MKVTDGLGDAVGAAVELDVIEGVTDEVLDGDVVIDGDGDGLGEMQMEFLIEKSSD